MCGLFGGAAIFLTSEEKKLISDLGVVSALRGTDSTGLISVRRGGKNKAHYSTLKDVEHPSVFLGDREVKEFMDQSTTFTLVGHCRAATVGDVNLLNAHPIQAGPIYGCHNGTVWSWGTKEKSDSRALFEKVAEQGIEKTLFAANKDHGHYALTYVDAGRNTLHLIRNWHRPLFYVKGGGGCFFWASEKWMLEGMKARYPNMKLEEVHFLKAHELMTIKLGEWARPVFDTLDVEPKVQAKGFKWEEMEEVVPPTRDCSMIDPNHMLMRPVQRKAGGLFVPLTAEEALAQERAMKKANKTLDRVMTQSYGTRYCTDCQKEKQYCNCASYKVKDAARKDQKKVKETSVPTVNRYPYKITTVEEARNQGYSCYHGFDERYDLTLPEAIRILNQGCANCTRPVILSDEVLWFGDDRFYCPTCAADEWACFSLGIESKKSLRVGGLD